MFFGGMETKTNIKIPSMQKLSSSQIHGKHHVRDGVHVLFGKIRCRHGLLIDLILMSFNPPLTLKGCPLGGWLPGS